MSAPLPEPMLRRRRRRWMAGLATAALLLVVDASRAPQRQVTAAFVLGAIHAYQATLSPLMPRIGVRCRFTPSCSHYAEGAVRKYGALGGSVRAVWRVLRCGPWTAPGTNDPP